MSRFQDPAPAAAPATSATTEAAPASFEASAPREEKSGELLLIYSYAFCWVAVLAFVVIAYRRTRRIEERIEALRAALDRAQKGASAGSKSEPA